MNTKYLTTLVTILETGSFQKAATQLNYTQSTVTSQIRQLEEEFQVPLFEKIGRRMVLTQAGQEILPYVNAILQNVEKIGNLHKELSEVTGTLRLAAPDSIFIYLLQPLIAEIRARAPHVRLSVISLPSEEINQAIASGMADIGIDCDKGLFPDSVIHEASRPCRACLVAAPSLDPADQDFITPGQRKSLSLVLNESKANYHKRFVDYLAQKGILLEPSMKLQSIEAVKRSVMNNLGIAYVPEFSVREELKSGALAQLKTELDDQLYPTVYLYHKNKWITPQMKLALQLLREQVKLGPV